MNPATQEKLSQLARSALEACLGRLSAVTPGSWSVESARALPPGSPFIPAAGQGAEAVAMGVALPAAFSTVLLFAAADAPLLAAAFSPAPPAAVSEGETALLEIGNITLNALVNTLLRAIRRSSIPSVPVRLPAVDLKPQPGCGAVIVSFTVTLEGRTSRAEIAAFLPPALIAAF